MSQENIGFADAYFYPMVYLDDIYTKLITGSELHRPYFSLSDNISFYLIYFITAFLALWFFTKTNKYRSMFVYFPTILLLGIVCAIISQFNPRIEEADGVERYAMALAVHYVFVQSIALSLICKYMLPMLPVMAHGAQEFTEICHRTASRGYKSQYSEPHFLKIIERAREVGESRRKVTQGDLRFVQHHFRFYRDYEEQYKQHQDLIDNPIMKAVYEKEMGINESLISKAFGDSLNRKTKSKMPSLLKNIFGS